MKCNLFTLLALIVPYTTWTQDLHPDTIPVNPRLLDMVVVTATRTPKLIMDVPVVTRVITSQDIQSSDAATVQDLLQAELPGIEFTYSMNQQVGLNMQGFGGNSVLFLVDGERLAGETLDNIDYSRLNLEGVERVEIVKGAASSLYGSNAVGGVVNLITRKNAEPWSFNLGARTSSLGEGRYNGALGFNHRRWNSQTNLQYTHASPLHLSDSSDLHTIYGNSTFNAKERLIFKASERITLTGRAGYFFREREKADDIHDRYRDFSAGLKGDFVLNSHSDLMLSYAFDQYDKSDYTVESHFDVRNYSNVQHTFRSLYNGTFSKAGTLTLGGDLMRDYLMSYQFTDGSHIQYTTDAFAQWDWKPWRRFNVVAALRYDYYSAAEASHFSPKINLMYKLPKVTLRANYANGFRAPTLKEMYMNFDMANIFTIYGNPQLKPEVSDNINTSVEWTHRRCNVTLMGFYNHVENRISTFWNQQLGGMLYSNMEPVNIAGLDLSACIRYDNGLGVRLSYIFTHESLDGNGMRSSATRPHTATLRLDYAHDWQWGRITVALNGRLLSSVTCDEYTSYSDLSLVEEQNYPGYTIWRLSISLHSKCGVNLTATVDNLFNYRPDYYYSNSPATVGRSVALGLSFDMDSSRTRAFRQWSASRHGNRPD